ADLGAGRIEVSPPHVTVSRLDTSPPASTGPGADAGRPDLVVIILDAARVDRFGFAGHNRDTSPNIDRLAASSLVYHRVFALAPYTLCSVPTMITGLSFLDHGVIDHSDVLSPDAVTLAEILKQHGYRTACFTATPNNSRAKGFDQGFDVFRELWTEFPGRKARRPHALARAVRDWLDREPRTGPPLHLQVHMVPPHAPYDPTEKFDLFTDPDYDGPCDGYHRTLAALDGGSMPATEACVEHLLNLYDGNIRMADDATEQILNALRRRPRWRDTVVLITSDHGEAFLEHGRTDHNSTVFTEMLHVPFVLHLPDGSDPGAVDTDGLATLADIVPTLLHAAGIAPPSYPDAVDLLATGRPRHARFAVTSTTGPTPTLGLRSIRWSLMLEASGAGSLYDLVADPGERNNLVFSEPVRFAGLGSLLTSRCERPPQLNPAARGADITDEERALLESLGYLQ
ncbi:MAG: sulfatase, partial [Holophagae bacterium]